MSDHTITPALTDEEWRLARLWHVGKMPGGKVRGMVVLSLPDDHVHGAAALALYGKPFGFTNEDVQDERATAWALRFLAVSMPMPPGLGAGWEAHADRHMARAAKIQALLPDRRQERGADSMGDQTIAPALTDKEWAAALHRGDFSYFALTEDVSDHARAALCLYGQPFGFTREQVIKLREDAEYLEGFYEEIAARLRTIADVIDALLPRS